MLNIYSKFAAIALFGAVLAAPALGQTITSANGQPWDIASSTGDIIDGGQDAFDAWGRLQTEIRDGSNAVVSGWSTVTGLGLTLDGSGRIANTTAPALQGGVEVTRQLYAPVGTDYLRYVDTFTNTTGAVRNVDLMWGGNLGSNGCTTVQSTANGDLTITPADTWAVTIEECSFDPNGLATDPPVGYVLGSANGIMTGAVGESAPPVPWPGNGNDGLTYRYQFSLPAGATLRLVYFLYRGLEEDRTGPLGQFPALGTESALARATVAALAAAPDLSGLSPAETATIANWGPLAPPAEATPVPTLSEWALIVLTLLVLAVAAFGFGRARRSVI